MIALATLSVSFLLLSRCQAPEAAPVRPRGTFLASMRDQTDPVVPGSLRARILAARAAAAPAPEKAEVSKASRMREERLLKELRPTPMDGLGATGRAAYLGRQGACRPTDLRLGSFGRRVALSRPPVRHRGRR